jgi:AsmA protein
MARALRILASVVAGLVIIVTGVGVAAPHFVPTDALRRTIAGEIAAITGQPVIVSGTSRFVALPWPTVTVDEVQIGGDDDAIPLVAAAGLEARLSLFPLLGRRTEVSGVTLHRPRITVVIDAEGRSNWRTGASILSMLVADPSSGAERGPRLGELSIRNGSILYRDDQARRRTEFSDVDLSISWPFLGARLTAAGRLRSRGEDIRFQGNLDRPGALFVRDISPVDFTFETGAVRAQVIGNALAAREIQIEGRLTFTSPSIRRIAAWLMPEVQNAPDIGPLQGSSKLRILDRTLTLEEAQLTMDRSRGEGAMTLIFDRTRTSIQGTMDFDTIDARPFLQTQIALPSDAIPPLEQIQGDRIGVVDVDLRLSTGALQFGRTTVRSAALSFMSRDGRMEASLGDGQVFGGRVQGRLVTEARPAGGIRMRASVATNSIRTDDALRELFGVIRVAGIGNITLNVAAEGNTAREITRSVEGEAALRLTQGTLTGIDLSTLIRRAERSPVEALLDARGGRSTIESATATFRIHRGLISTDDALLRGPGYRVALRGEAAMETASLNFTGVLASVAEGNRPFTELPFAIRGPWADPVVVPNPDGLIRRQPPAHDGTGGRIQ